MSYDGEKENIAEILEKVFDKFEKELNEMSPDENGSEFEYGKYMVISDKGQETEEVYGIFDYEIDALRRYNEVKTKKRKKSVCIIKADIEFIYLEGVRFIFAYKEV